MVVQGQRGYIEAQLKELAYHIFACLRDQYGMSISNDIEEGCTEKAATAVKENIFVKFRT